MAMMAMTCCVFSLHLLLLLLLFFEAQMSATPPSQWTTTTTTTHGLSVVRKTINCCYCVAVLLVLPLGSPFTNWSHHSNTHATYCQRDSERQQERENRGRETSSFIVISLSFNVAVAAPLHSCSTFSFVISVVLCMYVCIDPMFIAQQKFRNIVFVYFKNGR